MELGRRIAELRAAAGLKSRELAELAGIRQSYVSSIENGKKVPTIGVLQKIAKALNVTVSDLLGEEKRQLTPEQIELLNSAEGLTEMQLNAVINLLKEIKKANEKISLIEQKSADFMVAEKDGEQK